MWVSPDLQRTKQFVNNQTNGYDALLTAPMKDSFATHYNSPLELNDGINLFPKGEVMDSTICFLPTNDCGLGCKYCFSGAQPKKFGAIP